MKVLLVALSIILLTLSSAAQDAPGRVLAHNLTLHPRQQVIVFGVPCGKAPQGFCSYGVVMNIDAIRQGLLCRLGVAHV